MGVMRSSGVMEPVGFVGCTVLVYHLVFIIYYLSFL